MHQQVMWIPTKQPGLEHLHLIESESAISANGLVIGVEKNNPFRLRYEIECDAHWAVAYIHLQLLDAEIPYSVTVRSDGAGHWSTPPGESIPELEGCLDVDLSVTPFTNTQSIRRLGLKPGQSAEIAVAYFTVPDLRYNLQHQRYTCVETDKLGAVYQFESMTSNYHAQLRVNSQGLVDTYTEEPVASADADGFRRVLPQ